MDKNKVYFDDLEEEPFRENSQGGWVALLEHYFLTAIIPKENELSVFLGKKNNTNEKFSLGIVGRSTTLKPGDFTKFGYKLYFGPKVQSELKRAKENLVFAGKAIIKEAFFNCKIISITKDGDMIAKGQTIAKIKGDIRSILKKERVVLNLIQRLSAIATKVSKLAQITKEKGIELLDTRKTTPNFRLPEKWAVQIGGGTAN